MQTAVHGLHLLAHGLGFAVELLDQQIRGGLGGLDDFFEPGVDFGLYGRRSLLLDHQLLQRLLHRADRLHRGIHADHAFADSQHHAVQLLHAALQAPSHGAENTASDHHQAAAQENQKELQPSLLHVGVHQFFGGQAQLNTGIGRHVGRTAGQIGRIHEHQLHVGHVVLIDSLVGGGLIYRITCAGRVCGIHVSLQGLRPLLIGWHALFSRFALQ